LEEKVEECKSNKINLKIQNIGRKLRNAESKKMVIPSKLNKIGK